MERERDFAPSIREAMEILEERYTLYVDVCPDLSKMLSLKRNVQGMLRHFFVIKRRSISLRNRTRRLVRKGIVFSLSGKSSGFTAEPTRPIHSSS